MVNICVVCGGLHENPSLTCSQACHEVFVSAMEGACGKYKQVVDQETGVAYRVPTRYIIEKGLKYENLKNFPLWTGEGN